MPTIRFGFRETTTLTVPLEKTVYFSPIPPDTERLWQVELAPSEDEVGYAKTHHLASFVFKDAHALDVLIRHLSTLSQQLHDLERESGVS